MRHSHEILDEASRLIFRLLSYDPGTGDFHWLEKDDSFAHWKQWNSRWAGKRAGTNSRSYVFISLIIFGKPVNFRAHRIAWLISTGKWPSLEIDHINHNRKDNRFLNLKEASSSENAMNKMLPERNTSGYVGVSKQKNSNTWFCYAAINKKRKCFYGFKTAEDAHKKIAEYRLNNGFSPTHGYKK